MAEDVDGATAVRPDDRPDTADFGRPNRGRVTDYLLGGSHNFAVDRRAGDQLIDQLPELAAAARASRSFQRRAIRYLVDVDVRQFLVLGSGLPAVGHVHEVATDASVVYVDPEPVVVAHGRALLAGTDRARMVRADIREPDRVLAAPEVGRLIDLDRPVGLLMMGVLHHLPVEEDAAGLVAAYRKAVAPGSHLVVSVATRAEGTDVDWTRYGIHPWDRAEVAELFAGFDLVDPGLVHLTRWRPDTRQPSDERVAKLPGLVGVGRRSDMPPIELRTPPSP